MLLIATPHYPNPSLIHQLARPHIRPPTELPSWETNGHLFLIAPYSVRPQGLDSFSPTTLCPLQLPLTNTLAFFLASVRLLNLVV